MATESGYITDVEYPSGYFGHQAPALMNYIAAVNGYAAPPLDRPFTYCELGCGRGITSVILAATHPHARFYACDLNPAHVRHAQALAEAGGVSNVTFLERSVAQMLTEELPQFDFITLHGLWSWVPNEVRQEIGAFLQSRRKSGGLAMVSYNAMPGWAHIEPIRQMMRAYAKALSGDSVEKVRQAYAYVQHLADHKASYFTANPAAAEHLKTIRDADVRYVAYEYVNPHGVPFYFPDVCGTMRNAGLAFAGNMTPSQNYAEFMVPPQFQQLMKTAPSRTVLETHRDYIRNTRYRNDLYAAQPEVARAPAPSLPGLRGIPFHLADVPERLALRSTVDGIEFDFQSRENAVRAVHGALATGSASADAIHRAIGGMNEEASAALIQTLVLARHIWPCSPRPAAPGWSNLNAALLDAAIREKQRGVTLACPLMAGGQYFDLTFAAAIEAVGGGGSAMEAAKAVLERLCAHGHSISKRTGAGQLVPTTSGEFVEIYSGMLATMRNPQSADARYLRQLGVV